MIKPIMDLKLDRRMLDFLAQEMAALTLIAEDGRYTQTYASDLHHFNQQLVVQMEEQGVSLEEEEEGLAIHTFIPEDQRVPYISPMSAFMYDNKPIGEIKKYDSTTGRVDIQVLDKEFIERITKDTVVGFSISCAGEAPKGDL